jgi:hypothetical protein
MERGQVFVKRFIILQKTQTPNKETYILKDVPLSHSLFLTG